MPPVCRMCGCTDSQACTWFEIRDGRHVQCACWWVEPDLCSECVVPAEGPELPPPEPLLVDAAGRPLVFR